MRFLEEEGMWDDDVTLRRQKEDAVQSGEGEENAGADAETVRRFREGGFGRDAQHGDQQSAEPRPSNVRLNSGVSDGGGGHKTGLLRGCTRGEGR